MRHFNTAGPVRPRLHYCIPPLDRADLFALADLIRAQQYFVLRQLHAGSRSFPQSVVLCGVRDVRDYRIHAGS